MTKSYTGRCYGQRGYSDIIGNIFTENYYLEKTITDQLSLEDYKTLIAAKDRTSNLMTFITEFVSNKHERLTEMFTPICEKKLITYDNYTVVKSYKQRKVECMVHA